MDSTAGAQRDVIAFLSDAGSYGEGGAVEIHETHGSFVFLSGPRAFKLKRAVLFPYMDYSTPDRRRRMCERELAVNRRMAPSLYEEVRGIVRDGAKLGFGDANDPGAIDWVVVMRRFDQSDLLEARRAQGKLTRQDMLALADAVAGFHQIAELKEGYGGASGMRAVVDESVSLLAEFMPRRGHDHEGRSLCRIVRALACPGSGRAGLATASRFRAAVPRRFASQ